MGLVSLFYTLQYLFIQLAVVLGIRERGNVERKNNDFGISVLIPSFDEIYTIHETIKSILDSHKEFPVEIIVIDDGKGSETLNYLKRRFYFERVNQYKEVIDDKSVRNIFMSASNTRIYVIDKENEGKSKALNVALKIAHYKFVMTVDGDTIIDNDCLSNFYNLLGDNVLGIGGRIIPTRYKSNIVGRILYFFQKWEYFRNFSYIRIAFDYYGCVPLLSGALSIFNKDVLIKIGGYSCDTVGEDFDLTLKLHEYAKVYGGKVLYCQKAIAYTEVPFDIKSFFKQRLRWQIGMLEVLRLHKNLLHEKSVISAVLNLMYFYESTFSLIELTSLFFYRRSSLILFLIFSLFSMLQLLYLKHKHKEKEHINLLILMFLQVLIHIVYIVIRIISILRVIILKRKSSWGRVKRRTT